MKNFSLSIPQPCAENWDNFTPTTQGGHCSSCNKVVIDFTKMGDEEILNFFARKPAHTCGRFRPDQMKSYVTSIPLIKINPGLTLLKAGIVSLLLLLVSKPTSAQDVLVSTKTEIVQYPSQVTQKNDDKGTERIIRGIVKVAEDGTPLGGANVLVKGTTTGTATDAEGRFELRGDFNEGTVLVFTFIGFKYEEFVIKKVMSDIIEIQMALDMDVMGEVAVVGVYEENPSAVQKLWSKVKGLF